MWITKSKTEMDQERRSSANRYAFMAFFFIFILVSITAKVGHRKWQADFQPITWNEYISRIPKIIGFSIVASALTNLYLRKYPFQSGSMCMKCEKTFPESKSMTCDCGGQIRPVIQLKWAGDAEGQRNQVLTPRGHSEVNSDKNDKGGSNQAL